ncbi:MAG: hypothetical protein A4E35_00524 [Methanoregula sp. PtaU1.Bin051]|nr:MAG: hypothetical protein A4E35_00524 [Methanoregula sp. PtaU1.Bin051]
MLSGLSMISSAPLWRGLVLGQFFRILKIQAGKVLMKRGYIIGIGNWVVRGMGEMKGDYNIESP